MVADERVQCVRSNLMPKPAKTILFHPGALLGCVCSKPFGSNDGPLARRNGAMFCDRVLHCARCHALHESAWMRASSGENQAGQFLHEHPSVEKRFRYSLSQSARQLHCGFR